MRHRSWGITERVHTFRIRATAQQLEGSSAFVLITLIVVTVPTAEPSPVPDTCSEYVYVRKGESRTSMQQLLIFILGESPTSCYHQLSIDNGQKKIEQGPGYIKVLNVGCYLCSVIMSAIETCMLFSTTLQFSHANMYIAGFLLLVCVGFFF